LACTLPALAYSVDTAVLDIDIAVAVDIAVDFDFDIAVDFNLVAVASYLPLHYH